MIGNVEIINVNDIVSALLHNQWPGLEPRTYKKLALNMPSALPRLVFLPVRSMVALVGPPSGGPDPLYVGSSNPANVSTRRLEPPVVTLLSIQGAITCRSPYAS